MGVTHQGSPNPINFAHGNIGFLPWHRQYLRLFELALQKEVPNVTLPYWDWSDDVGAAKTLFTAKFLSSTTWGQATPINNGVLRSRIPNSEKPAWWPTEIQGFSVERNLREGLGAGLQRGSTEANWPPSTAQMQQLATLNVPIRGANPLWAFWLVLEQGYQGFNSNTHNAGHRFVGGHMGGTFSPNDPIFWMHHANVDRTWAQWQTFQLQQNSTATPHDFWPAENEPSPLDGRVAPQGHKLNDALWPWVGADADQYRSISTSQAVRNNLYDYSNTAKIKIADVLDFEAMGFKYA
jgi:tyrosinase